MFPCNGKETGKVEYSTEIAINSNLPNLIVFNVAFYMHVIRQFDSAHVKCDVETRPKNLELAAKPYDVIKLLVRYSFSFSGELLILIKLCHNQSSGAEARNSKLVPTFLQKKSKLIDI